jgi:type I restriction enzyme S subunit
MSEWKRGALVSVLDKIIGGGTPSRAKAEYWKGSIPWMSIKDYQDGKIYVDKTQEYITDEAVRNSATNLIPKGTPIFGTRVGVGKIALPTLDMAINQDLKALFPNELIDRKYLVYLLLLRQNDFVNMGIGSTVLGITLTQLKQSQINYPSSVLEQSKIVKILSRVDEVIEKTEAAIDKYKAIKAGMMQDLFTRGIDVKTGKLRPSYSDAPQLYKKTELGWVPKEWEVPQIKDIAVHIGSGITPTGGSNVYKTEGVLFLRSQNIHFDGLHLDDVAYIDIEMHNMMERSKLRHFDVLLNITGASIGRCCYLPDTFNDANVNQHVCIIRVANPTHAKALYLSTFLSSPFGQKQIDRLNAGGNREGLNYQQLRAFFVPWPKQDTEIERAAKTIDQIDRKIKTEIDYNEKMKLIKQGLMSDLLTGKVQVKYEEEREVA